MNRYSFIINPISGGKDKRALVDQIKRRASSATDIFFTQGPGHATQIAQEIKEHMDTIAVVGGDGSINEVARALIGSPTALAIIPTGSGNGLARHLHIPLNPFHALERLENPTYKLVDTVQINDKLFLCVAGMGFDAEVSSAFATSKKRGGATYVLTALKLLLGYRPREYELLIDGEKLVRTAFLIAFANCSQFGNGALIAPHAQIDDGLIDIVIIKPFPLYLTPYLGYRLFHRGLFPCRYVETLRAKQIDILNYPFKAHLDGEPTHFEGPVHAQIIPSSLRVCL